MKILFVCTGNTCRSPMAEAVCRYELTRRGIPGEAASAGLSPVPGDMTSPLTLQVLAAHGIPAEPKPAVPLTPELLGSSDIVAVMTARHAELLARVFPPVRPRLRVLDVSDPYGGGPAEYEQCFAQLSAAVDRLLDGLSAADAPRGEQTSAESGASGSAPASASDTDPTSAGDTACGEVSSAAAAADSAQGGMASAKNAGESALGGVTSSRSAGASVHEGTEGADGDAVSSAEPAAPDRGSAASAPQPNTEEAAPDA